MELKVYADELIQWLKATALQTKTKGMIVGLSGGLDSAVVAALIHRAFKDQCLALIMPCHSNPEDEKDAISVAKKIGIRYEIVDLTQTYDTMIDAFDLNLEVSQKATKLALGNTKARLRMATLYAIGQMNNYLVVGTDNYDEWYTGYFTKHGDGGVDLVPLIHLVKGEVRQLAELFDIPREVIEKTPSAGLFSDQSDEQELGVTYRELDAYLLKKKGSTETVEKIERLHRISEHKRHLALQPKPFIRSLKRDK